MQQVEVYRKLNFHKLGSPTIAASIECTGSGPLVNFGGDYHNSSTYESSAYIIDGYCTGLDEKYVSGSSLRYWGGDFNVDTGSTDLTGDTYAGGLRGRLVIGTTQSNASLNGVLGVVDVGASKNIQGNVFGVDAVLDFYGACTAGSGAAFHAGAIRGTIWNEGTTTVGGGGILAGLNLYQCSGAPTLGSGAKNPAIYIRSGTTAQAWQYGIYIVNTDVKRALQVGTASETGASIIDGSGINLAKEYGASSSNRQMGIEVNADTGSTDLTGDTYQAAIRGRTVIGTTQSNASLCGIIGQVDVGISKNIQGNVFGVDATLDFYGASTAGSGAAFHAGPFRGTLWNEGTTTVGAGGVLAGINLYQVSGKPTLGSGAVNPAVYIRSGASCEWQWGLYAVSGSCTYGIYMNCASLNATAGRLGQFYGSIATPNLGDGYGAFEIDLTTTGSYAGFTAALSSWVNITGTGAVGANTVCAQTNGVYADSGANTGSTVIFGMRMSGLLTDAPTVFAPFSLNTSNRAITALFQIASSAAIGAVNATISTATAATGYVPLFCDADGSDVRYVHYYASTS